MSTQIQWTDATWNPTTGCSRVSEGCRNCYIERTPPFRMQGRKLGDPVQLHPDRLDAPLHWKKPRRIFVNSMSDLFHEDVPEYFIIQVFFAMAVTPRHTYQILTKRPERMRAVCSGQKMLLALTAALAQFTAQVEGHSLSIRHNGDGIDGGVIIPNVWLGVSIEDQATADERIPTLLQTPSAVRFISAEPLLGPIKLRDVGPELEKMDVLNGVKFMPGYHGKLCDVPRLDWVILGGESGPGARPCDLGWIRSIKEQCQSAGVPVFVKQLGRKAGIGHPTNYTIDADGKVNIGEYGCGQTIIPCALKDTKGGDMAEWPPDLRVREFPRC